MLEELINFLKCYLMWKGDLDKVKEMKKCSQVELLK